MIEQFNGNAPKSDCVKDENAGIWYGGGGLSRNAHAARHCSDQGYFGSNGQVRDCGDWKFQQNCQEARPADWSACFRDEESRGRGYSGRDTEGNQDCKNRGYFGIDGAWKDCGSYYYSFHCGNPGWIGGWEDNGCQSDGTKKWALKVDTKIWDWDQAADFVINKYLHVGDKFIEGTINRITKDNKGVGGMWIIVYENTVKCTPDWANGWQNDGCRDDGLNRWSRRVDAKAWDWDKAANYMRTVTGNLWGAAFVRYENDNRGAGGMWVILYLHEGGCNPVLGNWVDNGCQSDSTKRWYTKIDAKQWEWVKAADWLINNVIAKVGYIFKTGTVNRIEKHKQADGMYIVVFENTSDCNPVWIGDWQNNGCQDDGLNRWSRRVDAKAWDWDKAANYMRTVTGNLWGAAFVRYENDNRGAGGMWVILYLHEGGCNPGFIGDWINDGCQADGTNRWAIKVDAKKWDWDKAADWLINNSIQKVNTTFKTGTINRISKDNKQAGGMWIILYENSTNCFVYNQPAKSNECLNIGEIRMTQQCNNWPNGWTASQDVVNACKKNAPANSDTKIFGTQVWSEWTAKHDYCFPVFIGDWKNDGCQEDGTIRWSIKVDAKEMSWETSANWLMDNKVARVGETFKTGKITKKYYDKKDLEGIWVIVHEDTKNCFVYNQPAKSNNCLDIGVIRMSQQCNNWPNLWTASQTVVDACKKNAPANSDTKIFATEVWSEWKANHGYCYPEFIGEWKNDGCQTDRTIRWSRKVDAKEMDWETSANWLINNKIARVGETFKTGKITQKKYDKKPAEGIWVIVHEDSEECFPSFKGEWKYDGCQADGSKRWVVQIDAKGMSWEAAAEWLLNNKVPKIGEAFKTGKVIKKDSDKKLIGMWVIVHEDNNECFYNKFIYVEKPNKECVQTGENKNKTRYTKQCNEWPAGWVASQNVVEACKKNAPIGSTPKIFGTQVWAEWFKEEDCLNKNGCDVDDNKNMMNNKCNVFELLKKLQP